MTTDTPSCAEHRGVLADQMICSAIADIWTELQAAADAGDEKAVAFLALFGPFAAERLGQRAPS